MILMFVIFVSICTTVTFISLDYITIGCARMPGNRIKYIIFQFMSSLPVTVIVNICLSYFLVSFTGAGMLAGMSNLASSIIVGIFAPRWMRSRFDKVSDPDYIPWLNRLRTSIKGYIAASRFSKGN